jgi:hypothetical protein
MSKFTEEAHATESWIKGHWRWLRWVVVAVAALIVGAVFL